MMKRNGIQKSTFKVAFCGIIAALSLALMMITSVIPIGTYTFPCFAGVLLSVVVVEYGLKWSMSTYFAVALLSLFLAGDKEAVVYFILVFGYYPMLKAVIETKIKSKSVGIILKFGVFNLAVIAAFFIGSFLLSIPAEEYELFGFYIPWFFLIIGNIIFWLYDRLVTLFVIRYVHTLRNKFFK